MSLFSVLKYITGSQGFEPRLTVLETAVLPITPTTYIRVRKLQSYTLNKIINKNFSKSQIDDLYQPVQMTNMK